MPLTPVRPACKSTAAENGFVQGNWKGLGNYGTLGLEIVLGVLLPCYLGSWADRRYETGNLLFFVGLFFGIAHAVSSVMRVLKQANLEAQAEEDQQQRERQKYYDERQ